MAAGFLANQNKPQFSSHDRYGHRVDLVEFHPAYHELMYTAVEHGLPSLPWAHPQSGAHVARAALTYLHSQAEAGTGCPLTMTFACVPALRLQPDLAQTWLPKILSTDYDPRNVGIAHKAGATIGMAMTEKQGGTDVRANTTRATPWARAAPAKPMSWWGTSGSARRRCAMRSSPWPRPTRASPASYCLGTVRTTRATSSISSV